MCRVYSGDQGTYIRLCYYHGPLKGQRVPVPERFQLRGPHYSKRQVTERKHGRTWYFLNFLVPEGTKTQGQETAKAEIEEMARYAESGWTLSWPEGEATLQSRLPWKNIEAIVQRAHTFGWAFVPGQWGSIDAVSPGQGTTKTELLTGPRGDNPERKM